jgi:hypothetical protein
MKNEAIDVIGVKTDLRAGFNPQPDPPGRPQN